MLIVEDNEQNMELASYLLEEVGYEVRQARTPAEARTEMARRDYQIVLMDMSLGGTDGLSLVSELREGQGPGCPVIALTAHAMRGDRERFIAGGCDGYISKPINTRTFVEEVTRFLDGTPGAPRHES